MAIDPLGEAFHREVVRRLAECLQQDARQTFLAFDPANIRYITGLRFVHGERPLAVAVSATGQAALYVPQLEAEHAASGWLRDIHWYPEPAADEDPVRWIAREVGAAIVVDRPPTSWWGTSGEPAAWTETQEDSSATAAKDQDEQPDHVPVIHDLGAELRRIKAPEEIALIERAAEYADLALERTFARLSAGSREWDALADVLAAIDAMMRAELGDLYEIDEPAIRGAIRGGTRAALPAASASSRPLARGESVVAEFVASVGGYKASSGATFFLGDPLRDVVRWLEATVAAQTAAREAMQPGATAESVDRAARKTLERNGLGNALRHRTGQGIGLTADEEPWLRRGEETVLKPGMVLVNQPGAYVAGRTGMRNSETVLVEEEGNRVLNPRRERWARLEHRLKEF